MRHNFPYKEPWLYVCMDAGVHPREASADDVLGTQDDRIRTGSGDRVILASEMIVPGGDEEWEGDPLDLGESLYDLFPNEVVPDLEVVIEVAGLTRKEAEVVSAIMDGTPMGHGYADRVAFRLGITPVAVRVHWLAAKRKLRAHWA